MMEQSNNFSINSSCVAIS